MDGPVHTVLIVDDHPGFRACARALLEEEGFDVIGQAETGASAVVAAEALRPGLVLLDVRLPDVDGFEVARRLALLPGGPAVVLTSSEDPEDLDAQVATSGARGFVAKEDLSGTALRALLA